MGTLFFFLSVAAITSVIGNRIQREEYIGNDLLILVVIIVCYLKGWWI